MLNESNEHAEFLVSGATLRAINKIENRHSFEYMKGERRFALGDDRLFWVADATGYTVTRPPNVKELHFGGGSVDWAEKGFSPGDKVSAYGGFFNSGQFGGVYGSIGTVIAASAFTLSIDFTESNLATSGSLTTLALPVGNGVIMALGSYDLGGFLLPLGVRSIDFFGLFDATDPTKYLGEMDQKSVDDVDFTRGELSAALEGTGIKPRGYILRGEIGKVQTKGISRAAPRRMVGLLRPAVAIRYNIGLEYRIPTLSILADDEHWLLDHGHAYLTQQVLLDLALSFRDKDLRAMSAQEVNALMEDVIAADVALRDTDRNDYVDYKPYHRRGTRA